MNREKAQEFYSAYREGTLEPGLCQVLEQHLNSDSQERADYDRFDQAVSSMQALKFVHSSEPPDLNERIRARVDDSLREARKRTPPLLVVWGRGLALAGVAAAVLVASFVSLRGHARVTGAGILAGANSDSLQFTWVDRVSGLQLNYQPTSTQTVVVKSGMDGKELRRIQTDPANPVSTSLRNPTSDGALFSVDVEGQGAATLVALPGQSPAKSSSGTGNLQDLARSLAEFYGSPVLLKVQNPNAAATWHFKALDERLAAQNALDPQKYSARTLAAGRGIVEITDND